jgi:hypothetical protein
MSTELIVVRAFMGDQAVAKELLAHGFAPELMPTREGRKVAETLLALRKGGMAPSLENLRHALEARQAIPAHLRRYLEALAMMPCSPRLHAVAHLQLLQLDLAMALVDQVSRAIGVRGGAEGGAEIGRGQAGGPEGPREIQPDVAELDRTPPRAVGG